MSSGTRWFTVGLTLSKKMLASEKIISLLLGRLHRLLSLSVPSARHLRFPSNPRQETYLDGSAESRRVVLLNVPYADESSGHVCRAANR